MVRPNPTTGPVTLEAFHQFAHSFPEVTEDFPFGPDVLALRVRKKIWALSAIDEVPFRVNLKCDPERAVELRAEYEGIIPGYHMNKQQWNTVYMQSDVPNDLLKELIQHSWELIVARMPKKDREPLMAQLNA